MYRTYRELGGSDKNAVIIVTKHLKESGTCRSYQFFKCPGVYFFGYGIQHIQVLATAGMHEAHYTFNAVNCCLFDQVVK